MHQQLRTGVTGNSRYDVTLSRLLFVYCMALPFEEALTSALGSILRIIGVFIMGYAVIIHFYSKIRLRDVQLLFPFICWLLLSFVSAIWVKDLAWWKYFIQIYFFQAVFVLVILAYQRFINLRYIESGLICGAVIAASIMIFSPSLSLYTDEGRRTIVLFDRTLDPNIVASIIMLGLFAKFDEFFSAKSRNKWMIIILIVLVLGLLYTGSRGALISFVIGFGMQLKLQMKERETRRRAKNLLRMGIFAALLTLAVLPSELLLTRFSRDTFLGLNEFQNGAHNRYTIWYYAFSLVGGAPVLGYGCGNFMSAIARVYRECSAHNAYILLLIENGIVGLAIFCYGIYRILKLAYLKKKYSAFAMLFSVCIMALTLDSLSNKYFWLSIVFAILSILKNEETAPR